MEYKLEDGDFLEREYAHQIRQYIPFYEKIWSLYIGHQGNGSMAELSGYPDKEKRTDFAEYSYTVLQSALVIHSIIYSGKLSLPHDNIKNILEFHKNLVAFYALIGRINDCLNKAAERIGLHSLKPELQSFYDQRNVILHGRTIPLRLDEQGMPQIPDVRTWDDKYYKWASSIGQKHKKTEDNIKETFVDLMIIVNSVYARMYEVISDELKSLGLKLEVVKYQYYDMVTSGSTRPYPITISNSTASDASNFKPFQLNHQLKPNNSKKKGKRK